MGIRSFPFHIHHDRSQSGSQRQVRQCYPGCTRHSAAGASATRPGVMHSTMADIDNALTELQSDRKPPSVNGRSVTAAGASGDSAVDTSRASFTSERTDAESENFAETEDFASKSVAARAALAANAQKNLADDAEREMRDQQRNACRGSTSIRGGGSSSARASAREGEGATSESGSRRDHLDDEDKNKSGSHRRCRYERRER